MKILGIFVLLIVIELVRSSQINVEVTDNPTLKGAKVGAEQVKRTEDGTIVSQVPVLTQQQRSRTRMNFLVRAGRRIVHLIDFVQNVLSKKSQGLKKPIELNTETAENMEKMKAQQSFLLTAASKLQDLEKKTKDLFAELSSAATILPLRTPNQNKRRNRKNKSNKQARSRKNKSNKQAGRNRKNKRPRNFRRNSRNRPEQQRKTDTPI